MIDQNNGNIQNNIDEEIEEKEEYEEEEVNQGNEEEGQEFKVAFNIQFSEGSFILLVGKTVEQKLILRLVDKEDDTKPFYQSEFSLNELKDLNSYFKNFINEEEAIDCIIKHLSESEKEIEILNDNNIELTILFNENNKETKIGFLLNKFSYVLEGEEEGNEVNKDNINNNMQNDNKGQDGRMEEEIEEVENDNNADYNVEHIEEANLEYSEENIGGSDKKESGSNEKMKNGKININKEEINKNLNLNLNLPLNNKNVQNENVLQTIIEETNEHLMMSPGSNKNVNDNVFYTPEKQNHFPDLQISRIIEELKENLDSLGGAMNYIEQEDEEALQKTNENDNNINNKVRNIDFNLFKNEILKTIGSLSDNFNNQLEKQNIYINKIQTNNENKFKEMESKYNQKISILEKNLNEAKNQINKSENLIRNQSNKSLDRNKQEKYNSNEIERIKNDLNTKIKDIDKKINEFKTDINKNNKNNDNLNSNLKTVNEKINNIDSRLKQNEYNSQKNIDLNNNNTNNINNFGNKIKNLETQVKILEGLKRGDNDKNIIDKISILENKSKDFDNKIKELQNNNQLLNVNEKLKNIENIYEQINKNDIIKKVNDLVNWSKSYENEFHTIENEIKNNNNYFDNLKKRINKLENKSSSRQSNTQDKNQNIKKQKLVKQQLNKSNDNIQNDNNNNNYRVLKQQDDNNIPLPKKYASQTFDKTNANTSHSVNKNLMKKNNTLDNNIEYQTLTKPRSRSKDRHKNRDEEKENQESKTKNKDNIAIKDNENNISESKIVEYDDLIFVENKIKEIYPKYNFDYCLVYRASDDGDKSSDFHNKCDKIGPNLTIVKTRKGYVFGGFTAKNWEHLKRDINESKPNLGSASRDSKAFGFCVNLQKIYNNEKPDEFAIWCNRNYGPTFKNNLFQVFDNCFRKGGYCSIRKNSHFGGQDYDYEISGGESKFAIEDVEVSK